MAYTTPRTWLVGESATAAMFNVHVRDNLGFLFDPPRARMTNSTNTSVGSLTGLDHNTVTWNEGFNCDTTNWLLASLITGQYRGAMSCLWDSVATGVRAALLQWVIASMSPIIARTEKQASAFEFIQTTAVADQWMLAGSGAYWRAIVQQSRGSATTIFASGRYLSAHWIGGL